MSDDSAVALADALRRLLHASVLSRADEETVAEVAGAVDALTARLSAAGLRDGMPWPPPEVMHRGDRPYNPVIGEANPIAPPLVVRVLDDGSVEGEATMRPIHEGPPGLVHGGWVASLLDQLLGYANASAGVGGFTAELNVRYRRPTPYEVPLRLYARVEETDGRRVRTSGEIVADGAVTAAAIGTFVIPGKERLAEVAATYSARSSPR